VVGLAGLGTLTGRPAGSRLTAREREIAGLIGLGLTNKEIAARLKISQRTADTHVQNMLNKLGASNRAQIVALAPAEVPDLRTEPVSPPVRVTSPPLRRLSPGRQAALVAGVVIATLLLSADRQAGLVPTASAAPAIADDFAGADVDSAVWDVSVGANLYVFKSQSRLAVYVGPDAGNAFQAGVTTVCKAGGDFDAQVAFELVTWPQRDALWVSLMGSGTPFNTYRTNRDSMDSYGAYLPPAGREVRAQGLTGKLRLTRAGGRWSGYFQASDRWSLIASGAGPSDDVGLSVVVFNGDIAPFGGREALVYFKNFRVTADRIVCP
jgi:DNA-binding CsgD family transcriptional regulator